MTTEITATEQIAELIKELGYRAEIRDDTSIRTGMSGWNVLVSIWPEHSIQMYFGIATEPEDAFGLEQANDFNIEHRFVKCSVQERSVAFENDFYFDVSESGAKEKLEKIFETWEISIRFAREALDKAKQSNEADRSAK